MTKLGFLRVVIVVASCAAALNADTWNKMTKVTFSGPVQVPSAHSKEGVISLPAGTYAFRLLESQSDRHIVEVTNPRGDHVYTTILAMNDYRVNASSKTVMYFSERKAGTPQAIKAWFYPGDNFGQRFVYPKAKATQIAAVVNQPVPFHNVEVVEKTKYVEIPVYIETPAKQETTYTASTFDKHDATDTAGADGETMKPTAAAPAAELPAKLPKTASPLPFMGLMGLLLLSISFLMRRVALRLK